MRALVARMNCTRYDRGTSGDPVPRLSEVVDHPSCAQVQAAIRRMEYYCHPIVTIATDAEEQHAPFGRQWSAPVRRGRSYRDMAFARSDGFDREVRLWASDQGYYCRERNIIRSRRKVLDLARAFFETGDFAKVAEVAV